MTGAKSVVGGSSSGYNPPSDRCRIKVIASVSAVVIFGSVAAICLWKGGVSSLANRKLCYIGFASSGVALAFAVAALILGCRRAPKESQKAAAPTPFAARPAAAPILPAAAPILPAAQPPAPTPSAAQSAATIVPAAEPQAQMLPAAQSPAPTPFAARPAATIVPAAEPPAQIDPELDNHFWDGFEFSTRFEGQQREEYEKRMAKHIATHRTNHAPVVPIDMLEHITLNKDFICSYLAGCSTINLASLPTDVRQAFVNCIIENTTYLANLIVDPKWINKTNRDFISSYLLHNKNNLSLLADLNEGVRTQFVEHITKEEPFYRYMLDPNH